MGTIEEKPSQLLELVKNLKIVGFNATFILSEKGLVLIVNKKKPERLEKFVYY